MTANVHSSVGDVQANVDDAAEFHLETFRGDSNLKNVERLPDVEINGVPFAHVQWEKETSWDSEYITVTPDGGTVVTVGWGLSKSDLDREGSQELIDPVMATFELT